MTEAATCIKDLVKTEEEEASMKATKLAGDQAFIVDDSGIICRKTSNETILIYVNGKMVPGITAKSEMNACIAFPSDTEVETRTKSGSKLR